MSSSEQMLQTEHLQNIEQNQVGFLFLATSGWLPVLFSRAHISHFLSCPVYLLSGELLSVRAAVRSICLFIWNFGFCFL